MQTLADALSRYHSKYMANNSLQDIAVAVSGGADSMALACALSQYYAQNAPHITIHALTVDHNLRPESASEAQHTAQELQCFDNVKHVGLLWKHAEEGDSAAKSRIQERARAARYSLMQDYMAQNRIKHLFLGHHMDDQAETFLFRLSKGSGLDGLSCMHPYQERGENMFLCRPFLDIEKQDLITGCEQQNITYINDPSNESEAFARVRLRQSMDVLSEEGLTPKRLATMASRFARARACLDKIAEETYRILLLNKNTDQIVLNFKELIKKEEELILRVVIIAMNALRENADYNPRFEKVERLCDDLKHVRPFRKQTLGGIIFDVKERGDTLTLSKEHPE